MTQVAVDRPPRSKPGPKRKAMGIDRLSYSANCPLPDETFDRALPFLAAYLFQRMQVRMRNGRTVAVDTGEEVLITTRAEADRLLQRRGARDVTLETLEMLGRAPSRATPEDDEDLREGR